MICDRFETVAFPSEYCINTLLVVHSGIFNFISYKSLCFHFHFHLHIGKSIDFYNIRDTLLAPTCPMSSQYVHMMFSITSDI